MDMLLKGQTDGGGELLGGGARGRLVAFTRPCSSRDWWAEISDHLTMGNQNVPASN